MKYLVKHPLRYRTEQGRQEIRTGDVVSFEPGDQIDIQFHVDLKHLEPLPEPIVEVKKKPAKEVK